jgi:hypothetical protein
VIVLLQNCGDENITNTRCSNIGYIENLKNLFFDKISEVKTKEWELKSRQMQNFQNLSS